MDLARNLVSDSGAEKLAIFLAKNPPLRNLNLHWNKIKMKGGFKLADALLKNNTLKFLDLSWNALGKVAVPTTGYLTAKEVKQRLRGIPGVQIGGEDQVTSELLNMVKELERVQMEVKIGKAWGKALKHNKTLVHLDMSYNCFGVESCQKLQKKIKSNHSLYGLHMAGNACNVDSHGFIQIEGSNPSDKPAETIMSPNSTSKSMNRRQ